FLPRPSVSRPLSILLVFYFRHEEGNPKVKKKRKTDEREFMESSFFLNPIPSLVSTTNPSISEFEREVRKNPMLRRLTD
ncbi:hypothetical protein VIGAN_01431700, partial [Vigna angularis var. angularis]